MAKELCARYSERKETDAARICFSVTGSAAHTRLAPLLPSSWTDKSPYATSTAATTKEPPLSEPPRIDFLWENAPRHETKAIRDHVQVYSHLPNGTSILDSKWVLARLFGSLGSQDTTQNNLLLAILKTHCFQGRTGFQSVSRALGLLDAKTHDNNNIGSESFEHCSFRDLEKNYDAENLSAGPSPSLWVVKDAMANGAGGIWIVGPENAQAMIDPDTSPLIDGHHYVAQAYAWPPVLFRGRKCHVRVYGCMTSDGRAFCHERCFLHVANHDFSVAANEAPDAAAAVFDDSVHITNCCANSHDPAKFSGEICASLSAEPWDVTRTDGDDPHLVVSLKHFAPSIYESVRTLAQRTFPFLQGGRANNGFEYLGMDFILSYSADNQPIVYLLEVNAPPSQDTATGLNHAEDLHDDVLRDLLSLWVLPKITGDPERPGGWKCVYKCEALRPDTSDLLPSKAALVNKIRWTIYERKVAKDSSHVDRFSRASTRKTTYRTTDEMQVAIRSLFPYFATADRVFLESAGGAQVPQVVINAVAQSLSNRHRTCLGAKSKAEAAATMSTILGASLETYSIHFDTNATTLLSRLAQEYVRLGRIKSTDEIIISTENHLANVNPWIAAARAVDATIHWLHVVPDDSPELPHSSLEDLVTSRTRLVIVSHASNILGEVRNIRGMKKTVDRLSDGKAELVVDGVAAAPHLHPELDSIGVDWYAVSCHKLFGPHLGVLVGRKELGKSMNLELGTTNYEACAGIVGLGEHFVSLARLSGDGPIARDTKDSSLCRGAVKSAYRLITRIEAPLSKLMLTLLEKSPNVKLLRSVLIESVARIPVFSFHHVKLSNVDIVAALAESGLVARQGTFLSSKQFQRDFALDEGNGVVRLSLAHYTTEQEIRRLFKSLEAIPGW